VPPKVNAAFKQLQETQGTLPGQLAPVDLRCLPVRVSCLLLRSVLGLCSALGPGAVRAGAWLWVHKAGLLSQTSVLLGVKVNQ